MEEVVVEEPLRETDAEFFKEHSQFASFFDKMDLPELDAKKKDRRQNEESEARGAKERKVKPSEATRGDSDDDACDYEHRPRQQPQSWRALDEAKVGHERLPIKNKDGTLVRQEKASPAVADSPATAPGSSATSKLTQNAGDVDTLCPAVSPAVPATGNNGTAGESIHLEASLVARPDDAEEQDQAVDGNSKGDAGECEDMGTAAGEQEGPEAIDTDDDESLDEAAVQASQIIRARYILTLKVRVAEICNGILEDPETSVRSRGGQPSVMQQLHALGASTDIQAKRLVMLSQLSVFCDILPGYHIRPLTAAEKGAKVSSEVQRTRGTENALLAAYQTYLRRLSKALEEQALLKTAAKCLCHLVVSRPTFNFWRSILATVVPLADRASAVGGAVSHTLEQLLKNDHHGHLSLEIVRLVTRQLKKRKGDLGQRLLDCLRHTKVAAVSNQKRKRLKMKRKKMKRDDVEKALAEAEAFERKEEVALRRSDCLREILLIYFRLLRSTRTRLYPAALGGLRRVAHLLHLDVAAELLQLLAKLVVPDAKPRLPLRCAFEVVLTAMRTAQGPGQELRVDLTPFAEALRRGLRWMHLPRYCTGPDACVETVTYSIASAFLKRREADPARVAASASGLVNTALHQPPHCALAALASLRELLQRYTVLKPMIAPPEAGSDFASNAMATFLRNDTASGDDNCDDSGSGSTAWPLSLLASHYHPLLSQFARQTAVGALPHPHQTAPRLLELFNASAGGFNPPIASRPAKVRQKAAAPTRRQWRNLPTFDKKLDATAISSDGSARAPLHKAMQSFFRLRSPCRA